MGWTYEPGNLATSPRDQVRWLSGDRDTNDQQVQDEEIDWVLAQQPNVYLAAADVCEAIAAQLSRLADARTGDVQESLSQKAKAYQERANALRSRAATLAAPIFGGLSKSEKQTLAADADAVQPAFLIGQGDSPDVTPLRDGGFSTLLDGDDC